MGILDHKKKEEILKTVHSYTREDLLAWVEMDKKRISLAEQEDDLNQSKPFDKLNGASNAVAKSKGTPAKNPARTTKIRAKAMATADSW